MRVNRENVPLIQDVLIVMVPMVESDLEPNFVSLFPAVIEALRHDSVKIGFPH